MQTTIKLDTVLDLIWKYQEELASEIDNYSKGSTAYDALWEEYKRVSSLYDDIRRAANDD